MFWIPYRGLWFTIYYDDYVMQESSQGISWWTNGTYWVIEELLVYVFVEVCIDAQIHCGGDSLSVSDCWGE